MGYFFAFVFLVWFLYRRGMEQNKWGGFIVILLFVIAALISMAFD